MDPEMKSLLTVLLDKVERIDAKMATKDDIARLDDELHQIKGELGLVKDEQRQMKDGMLQLKDEQRRMNDEQRQMKEMLGNVRLKEVARLDGRIDQLAQDVALGRNPNAA
jgi:hypothetical protein